MLIYHGFWYQWWYKGYQWWYKGGSGPKGASLRFRPDASKVAHLRERFHDGREIRTTVSESLHNWPDSVSLKGPSEDPPVEKRYEQMALLEWQLRTVING